MITRVKTILIILFCMTITLSYTFACSPGSGDVFLGDGKSQTDDSEDSIINQKLNELKDRMVSPPVVLSHKSGETIYGSGDRELIFIKGYADRGNTIEVYVNGALDESNIIADSSGNFETTSGIEIAEGKNVIKLVSVRPSGIKSSPTEFTLFLDVPQKVEYKIYKDKDNLKEISESYHSQEDYPSIYIKGTHLPLSSIYIQVNDRVIGEVECGTNGIFEMEDIVLKPGSNEIAVWTKATDGFISTPVFKNIMVNKDLYDPIPSDLAGYKQGNVNYLSWNISTDIDFYSYKLVRVEDPCINPEYPEDDVIATFSDISASSYVDSNIISGRSYYYTLWTVDKAGRAISSNVLAIPKPVYSISIERVSPFSDISVNRREWFYQYFEITNMGNVTVDLGIMEVWVKLNPGKIDTNLQGASYLWAVHLWNPSDGQYYYSGRFDETFLVDRFIVSEEEEEDAEEDEEAEDSSARSLVGSRIEGIKPGEKIKIAVKIQNISAANNEEIITHFHFAPVDCDGYFFIDEIVSTEDIFCKSSGRN